VEVHGRDGAIALGKGELELIDNQDQPGHGDPCASRRSCPTPSTTCGPISSSKRGAPHHAQGRAGVPASTLQRGPDGTFVYVVGTDQTVTLRPVEAVAPTGEVAIIDKGVSEGEIVVADGQNQLRPGSKVSCASRRFVGCGRGSGRTSRPRPQGSGNNNERIEPFIRRPVATSLLTVGLLLSGFAWLPPASGVRVAPGGLSTIVVATALPVPVRKPWPRR